MVLFALFVSVVFAALMRVSCGSAQGCSPASSAPGS
jgi:hypothetical protein